MREDDRMNILIIISDQLRPFELGCYGHPLVRTPHLDALARAGTRFEHAVTPFPVCMAARSCLLSGRYNRSCTGGVGNVALPCGPDRFTLPEYPALGRPHLRERTPVEDLRDAGWLTAVIGKWHLHSWPQDVGFTQSCIPRVHHCHTGQSFCDNGGIEYVPPGYSVDYECDRVEGFLAERGSDRQPFLLYHSISPPHCPLADAPERYLRRYDPAALPLRPNSDPDHPFARTEHWYKIYRWDFRYYELHLPACESLPPGYGLRQLYAEYCGLVSWADDAVGRTLRALERAGLAEETLVFFIADHGDLLGSHGQPQKGPFFEESIRIPFLVRGPGVAAQVNTSQVASLVDVLPTALARAGLPRAPHLHGVDLSAALTADVATARPHAFIENGQGICARAPRRVVALERDRARRALADTATFAYDLAADPYQRERAAAPGPADPLIASLRAWDAETPWMADHAPR